MNGIMQCVYSLLRLVFFSFDIISLSLFKVLSKSTVRSYLLPRMHHSLLTSSLIKGHLDSFLSLTVMNIATMNTCVQVLAWE